MSPAPDLKIVAGTDTPTWPDTIAGNEFRRWAKHERFRNALLGASGKRPAKVDSGQVVWMDAWNQPHTLDYLTSVAAKSLNIGLRTGDLPVADADCPNPLVADAVEKATAKELGVPVSELTVRYRPDSAKRTIMFALKPGAERFTKSTVVGFDAAGEKQKVEFLAEGQQTIVAGKHPDGAMFQIRGPHPADVGPDGMIQIDHAMRSRLEEVAAEAMVGAGCTGVVISSGASSRATGREKTGGGDPAKSREAALTCLRNVKNDVGTRFDDHNKFVGLVAGIEVMCEPYLDDEEVRDAMWRVYLMYPGNDVEYVQPILDSNLDRDRGYRYVMEITGQGLALAQEDFRAPLTAAELKSMGPLTANDIASMADMIPADDLKALLLTAARGSELGEPAEAGAMTPFSFAMAASVPPRAHLYSKHYTRRVLGCTVAPGGGGKSSLEMVEAIAMATGKPLLGVPPKGQLRGLYWNGEDEQNENLRKARAVGLHYGIGDEEIGGRLFLRSNRDHKLMLADAKGLNNAALARFEQEIRKHNLDFVILDPFVGFHGLPENDNTAIGNLCYALAGVADRCDCAIELAHHTRKPAVKQTEASVDDGRGASAMLAAVRSGRVLNRMPETEAQKAGIHVDDCWRYSRRDNGKANFAPRGGTATWLKMVSVPLWNGPDGSAGDEMGVFESWTWPDRSGEFSLEEARAIQEAIGAGEWLANMQAKEKWAGHAIANALDMDLSEPADKEAAKVILKALIADGSLKKTKHWDENRNERWFVVVGEKVKSLRQNQQTPENGGFEW
jgi:hypothetical protein